MAHGCCLPIRPARTTDFADPSLAASVLAPDVGTDFSQGWIMSTLRFTCPSCGQHMQCERAYVGDIAACTACHAQLRIPYTHTPPEPSTQLPRATLIAPPPESATESANCFSEIPTASAAHTTPFRPAPPDNTPQPEPALELHCICPVCQSELSVSTRSPAGTTPQLATLVNKAASPGASPSAAHPPEIDTASVIHREEQIAEAREAHPVSLYPAMKPRLSYILGDGSQPPHPGNSPTAPDESDPAKPPVPPSSSFPE